VTMYVPSARSNRRTISGSSTSRRPSRITFAGSAMDRERTAHQPFQRKSRQAVSRAASGTKAQLVFPVLTRSHDDSTLVSVKLNAGIGLAAQTDAGLPSPGKTRASEPRAQQAPGSGKRGRENIRKTGERSNQEQPFPCFVSSGFGDSSIRHLLNNGAFPPVTHLTETFVKSLVHDIHRVTGCFGRQLGERASVRNVLLKSPL
jgi:hypothetical protein